MVMAHPDDEIIFGWPIFQMDCRKTLLMCSTDMTNTERTWCSHRKEVLEQICNEQCVQLHCLDYPSSFYKLPSRNGELRELCDEIQKLVCNMSINHDCIFTHNPIGEYGHMDHKLLFKLVLESNSKPLMYTDICHQSNWHSYSAIPKSIKSIFYQNKIIDCQIDKQIYIKYKTIYKKAGAWTWSMPPVDRCGLYRFETVE